MQVMSDDASAHFCKLEKSGPPPWKFPEISAPLKSNPGFWKQEKKEEKLIYFIQLESKTELQIG